MTLDLPRLTELAAHALAAVVVVRRTRPGGLAFVPSLRPLAWFLVSTSIVDALRWAIQANVLQVHPRPFVGMARVLFHVDHAGFVGWNAAIVMVTTLAFATAIDDRIRLRTVAIGAWWVVVTGALIACYPGLRGKQLGYVYACLHAATTLISVAIAAKAWRKDAWFGAATRAVTILLAGDLATILGPYLGEPFRYWSTAQAISTCVYLLVAWELRASRLTHT